MNDVDRAMMLDPVAASLRHRDDGMVVGTPSTSADTYRVMFFLASRSRGHILQDGRALRESAIPNDVKWMILLPGAEYSGPGRRHALGPMVHVQLR
jgi:hypothetical protein